MPPRHAAIHSPACRTASPTTRIPVPVHAPITCTTAPAPAPAAANRFSTIPSLRLRGPGSGAPAVLARGVTVFRVDSLEGEPIGQAVLVESWRRLTAEEEAADEAA